MSKSDRFPEIHPNMSKPETTNPGPSSQGGAGNTLTPADSKKGGKILSVKVHMLDDQIIAFSVPQKAFGQILFDQVCKYLNLLESDYFGMEYAESGGIKGWLDPAKPLLRQVNHCQSDSIFKFSVKFYTPDPGQLEEEYTRYLFALQIKHDLATGALSCNENTTALLASYILQAEYGDYEGDKCADLSYLDAFKFISLRNEEIQKKVVENHKKHVGQSPAEADLNLLETARRCELYGISMHPAKDHEGVALNLAVAHMGVLVFQNLTKINTFSWAKIRKLSFKRKRFLIKLHPEGYGYYKDTVEFYFESRNECKNFWKKCIEHHGFFRCATVKRLPRPKARVFSKGSSFRYSGRTQKEIMEYVRENYLKRQPFTRTASSRVSGQTSVGTSLAATPLLPLASDTRFSTSASRSSGSQPITSSHENMLCTEMAEVSVHDGSSNSETRTLELGRSREMTPINPKAPSSPVANGMLQEENADMYQEEEASPTTTTNPLLITNEASIDEPMEQQGSTDLSPSHSIKINNAVVSSELIETNANDNDDNISHDSYHLEDHEDMQGKPPPEQTKNINSVQNLPTPPPSPVKVLIEEKLAQESISENQEIISKTDSNQNKISNKLIYNELKIEENIDEISYVLHKRHLSKNKLVPPSDIDPLGRSAVLLSPFKSPTIIPKITVEIEHHKIAQTSPTLYARNRVIHNSPKSPRSAQSFKNSPPKSPKFFPGHQSLDFVSRNKLPPKDSFSSEDHTVNVGSLEVLIEYLQKKRSTSPSGRSQDSDQSQSSPAISLKNGNNQKNLNVAFKNTATQISSEPFLIRHSEIVEDLSDSSSDSHSIPSQHVSLEDLTDMKRLSDGCMYGNRHSFLFQESFDSAGQSSVDGYCLVKDSSREKSPKAENNLEGEEFDDTSSAGNGTVCEETSLHEGIEVLEDLVHSDMVEQSSSDSDHSDSSSESDDSENLASPHTPDKKSVNSAISRESTSSQRHRTYMCVEISNGQIIENKHARLDDDSFLESHDGRCTDLDVSQFEHDQDSAIGSTSEHSPS